MKKILLVTLFLSLTLGLSSCGSEKPLTEAQQAEKYNMSVDEYQETKEAASRMNMTIEGHMNMTENEAEMDMGESDMSDDSSMIENDMKIMDSENNMGDVDTPEMIVEMNNIMGTGSSDINMQMETEMK